MLTMYDAVTVANLPAGGDAYGCYVDGRTANAAAVHARFPGVRIVTIAVRAADNADCLDVERWDATPAQAPAWVRRQIRLGAVRPILYASRDTMPAVLAELAAVVNNIPLAAVRLWSAHYGGARGHICSPASCGATFTADGTQWAGSPGNSPGPYDVSMLAPSFFYVPPPPPPTPDEAPMIIRCTDQAHSGATLVLEQGVVVSLSQPADLDQYTGPVRTLSPGTFDQYAERVVIPAH